MSNYKEQLTYDLWYATEQVKKLKSIKGYEIIINEARNNLNNLMEKKNVN